MRLVSRHLYSTARSLWTVLSDICCTVKGQVVQKSQNIIHLLRWPAGSVFLLQMLVFAAFTTCCVSFRGRILFFPSYFVDGSPLLLALSVSRFIAGILPSHQGAVIVAVIVVPAVVALLIKGIQTQEGTKRLGHIAPHLRR